LNLTILFSEKYKAVMVDMYDYFGDLMNDLKQKVK